MPRVWLGMGGLNKNCVVWVVIWSLGMSWPHKHQRKPWITKAAQHLSRSKKCLVWKASAWPFCQQKDVQILCILNLKNFLNCQACKDQVLNSSSFWNLWTTVTCQWHLKATVANYFRQALLKIGLCQQYSFTFLKETIWEKTTLGLNKRSLCKLSILTFIEVRRNSS